MKCSFKIYLSEARSLSKRVDIMWNSTISDKGKNVLLLIIGANLIKHFVFVTDIMEK